MANNRMYIRCKKCDEGLYLAKTFGWGYFWSNKANAGIRFDEFPLPDIQIGADHLEDEVNEFFKDHAKCGENAFEIVYEVENNAC